MDIPLQPSNKNKSNEISLPWREYNWRERVAMMEGGGGEVETSEQEREEIARGKSRVAKLCERRVDASRCTSDANHAH